MRSARILRGMKSGDLAEALQWPPSRQTKLEQAEIMSLAAERVAILVKELRFPERYFVTSPTALLSPNDLLFRAPVAAREKTYLAEFARMFGEILEWLDSYYRLPPVKLPALPPDTPISEAARQTREALGVAPDEPIRNLTHSLERAGVPVAVRKTPPVTHDDSQDLVLPEKHLGYSTRVGEHADRPVIVLRSLESWERIRWTTAHETGHITLHGRRLPADAEEQASAFASELLAPANQLRTELPRYVTLAALTDLKVKWGISIGALITHLHTNNLITTERFETLRKQLYTRINPQTGRTWGRDEPEWDSPAWPIERPRLLSAWMERFLGGSAPHLVANLSGVWPADLIEALTSGQRAQAPSRPQTARRPVSPRRETSEVIDLSSWRRRA